MDLFSSFPSNIRLDPLQSSPFPTEQRSSVAEVVAPHSDSLTTVPLISSYSGPAAANNDQLIKLVSGIFNESFGFRPDGKPYRLGPKSVTERLLATDYLFVAGDDRSGIGYLFGKEIPSSQGRIAWIESMAVLPLYRRKRIATALVDHFAKATKAAPRFGFATPNPIAALIATRLVAGKVYIGPCYPPYTLRRLLKEIRQNCFDLRGCYIDEDNMTIRTGFSPLSRSDQREWSPRQPLPEPPWWQFVQLLANEFEALLVIEK